MPREALPVELIERVVGGFEPLLPEGVFVSLRGRELDVRSVRGGGLNDALGEWPWPPMPAATKWRLAIQSVYETVARGIGNAVAPQMRLDDFQSGNRFRIVWPVVDATVRVSVSSGSFIAEYLDSSGGVALAMPTVEWRGPATEPVEPWSARSEASAPRRYFGDVSVDVREKDAERDRDAAARSQESAERRAALSEVVANVKRRDPGSDKDAIRAAFREAFAAHPSAVPPPQGSVSEDRLVDGYAATQGPAAGLRSGVVLGKRVWDVVRILRGTHPDLKDDLDDEDTDDPGSPTR